MEWILGPDHHMRRELTGTVGKLEYIALYCVCQQEKSRYGASFKTPLFA
jgi:hypothetical protein